jgi:hypothetical protein
VTVMLVSTATWMVSGPTVTATVLRAWATVEPQGDALPGQRQP